MLSAQALSTRESEDRAGEAPLVQKGRRCHLEVAALRARCFERRVLPPDLDEVEALLECIENGRPCPVFEPDRGPAPL